MEGTRDRPEGGSGEAAVYAHWAGPEGLTGAKGAVRLTALRTGMRLIARGLGGPWAGGRKLPPYGGNSLTLHRGEAVRFILQCDGPVSERSAEAPGRAIVRFQGGRQPGPPSLAREP